MINFNYETDFNLDNEDVVRLVGKSYYLGKQERRRDKLCFCDDEYLHKINVEYLDHDTLTDIISFDYSIGNELHGDIFVSIERVKDNAVDFNVSFEEELKRVLVHGILHYCGYKTRAKQKNFNAR
jgi:rRNA maturation RNase YbeY